MIKRLNFIGIVGILALVFIFAGCGNQENPAEINNPERDLALNAVATCELGASDVEDFFQGTLKNGNPITNTARLDPNNAKNLDASFFSLGFGGYIVVKFDDLYTGELTIFEETWGAGYPEEKAEVYVSADNVTYTYMGMATNKLSTANQRPTTFDLEGECIQYVKIVDDTDPAPHSNDADAFDLNAVCLQNAQVCPQCEPLEKDLWAGAGKNDITKGTLVGNVTISNDGENLYVNYTITGPDCYMTEAHVYAGTAMPSTAAPGQFTKIMEFSEGETSYEFIIPLSEIDADWECGDGLYVAAHAIVCCGLVPEEAECETAWALGEHTFIDEGISKKWGWFLEYEICCD